MKVIKGNGIVNKFLDRTGWFSGHIKIGRLTIFGRNAMHYAWNYKRRDNMYVCFRPPSRCFGMNLGYYFYISPDGTPNEAVYYRPKKHWGIEEPNDPSYHEAVWRDKVIQFDLENGDRYSRHAQFKIKPRKHYLKKLKQDYVKYELAPPKPEHLEP
jgi:hypothetical protein